MRFMTIVKSAESAVPPPQALLDAIGAIGRLGQEAAGKGVMVELHRHHWKGWEGEVELRQLFDPPGGGAASA